VKWIHVRPAHSGGTPHEGRVGGGEPVGFAPPTRARAAKAPTAGLSGLGLGVVSGGERCSARLGMMNIVFVAVTE
jgi:hypothetical protein